MSKLEELYTIRKYFLEYDTPIPERLSREIAELETPYLEKLNNIFSDIVPSDLPVKELSGRVIIALEYNEGDLDTIYSSRIESDEINLNEMVKTVIEPTTEEFEEIDDEEYEEVKRIGKSPSTPFKVTFTDDGTTILEDDAISTMVEALKYIGLKRVSYFTGVMFKGYHLVDKRERRTLSRKGKPVKWQKKIDGWWIYSQITNETKIRCIEQVAEFLKIPLVVEYV